VKRIVAVVCGAEGPVEWEGPVLSGATVHLRADCDFRDRADVARFFYSMDGRSWVPIGDPMKMVYTLPHFMGYRFALFCYATRAPGGRADFHCFRPEKQTCERAVQMLAQGGVQRRGSTSLLAIRYL
jgi:hypothetical protein